MGRGNALEIYAFTPLQRQIFPNLFGHLVIIAYLCAAHPITKQTHIQLQNKRTSNRKTNAHPIAIDHEPLSSSALQWPRLLRTLPQHEPPRKQISEMETISLPFSFRVVCEEGCARKCFYVYAFFG
jgi:hypothetical protein